MGIDYGTKKVGIAMTDEAGSMAFPRTVIPNDAALLETLVSMIETESVGEIVIGHSLNTDGMANPLHTAVEALITDLTLQVGVPIHLVPEQYTTQLAMREQGRHALTDASAAALILETYLAQS